MNDNFRLHPKLKKDNIVLGQLRGSILLLMNNALVPWFILVPKTDKLEIHELTDQEHIELQANIILLSKFIQDKFSIDKLNIASIGNVVAQMHIHVVGRRHDDYCWPNVVWGRPEKSEYDDATVESIVDNLTISLTEKFLPSDNYSNRRGLS